MWFQRHGHWSKWLCRRSSAARRSSEGGAPAAAGSSHTSVLEVSPQQHHQEQVETDKVTQEEIEEACMFAFHFEERLEEIMMMDADLRAEIDGLSESKALYDEKVASLKKAIKSPDSSKVKQVKHAERESFELEELIYHRKRELEEVQFLRTTAEVTFSSSACLISQYADRHEDGSMIGYLAHILRME